MKSPIQPWVRKTFCGDAPKLFVECGAHRGEDTAWLAAIPGVTLHAFEPDPRNIEALRPTAVVRRRNVTLHPQAIAAHTGTCWFIPSCSHRDPFLQTASGSIRAPKSHLQRWPRVKFGAPHQVSCVTLDSFAAAHGVANVDLMWWDIQGAERDAIAGGQALLARTRLLFTEYCPDGEEWYDGQASYSELLRLLPGFRVLQKWEHDVLLANEELAA